MLSKTLTPSPKILPAGSGQLSKTFLEKGSLPGLGSLSNQLGE